MSVGGKGCHTTLNASFSEWPSQVTLYENSHQPQPLAPAPWHWSPMGMGSWGWHRSDPALSGAGPGGFMLSVNCQPEGDEPLDGACLVILISLRCEELPTVGGAIPWLGSWRKDAERSICLATSVSWLWMGPAASSSSCLDTPACWAVSLNYEPA